MIDLPGISWEPFYISLPFTFTAAVAQALDIPIVRPGEEVYIIRAAFRVSANTVNPVSMGVFQYQRYFRMYEVLTPTANVLYPVTFDILLSEGMTFRGYFESPAGTETIELIVHGLRRKIDQ